MEPVRAGSWNRPPEIFDVEISRLVNAAHYMVTKRHKDARQVIEDLWQCDESMGLVGLIG